VEPDTEGNNLLLLLEAFLPMKRAAGEEMAGIVPAAGMVHTHANIDGLDGFLIP
jgi:hypothetical protein